MIKTLQTIEKRDREPYKVPRSVQHAIPIQRIWDNGIGCCTAQLFSWRRYGTESMFLRLAVSRATQLHGTGQ